MTVILSEVGGRFAIANESKDPVQLRTQQRPRREFSPYRRGRNAFLSRR